jgi:cytochrome c
MKSLISIACAFLLLGCSNENPNAGTSVQTPSPTVVEENTTTDTTPTVETSAEATVEAPAVIPATTPPTAQIPKPVATTIDGGALYGQKCASCHGAKAEKSALNKSQIIAGWKDSQVKDALKGYQAGTYGKEMKAIMQGQAKALNDAQIEALAKHIAGI